MATNFDTLLARKEDFAPYRVNTVNFDNTDVDPFIREAQIFELRSFLGEPLYNEMEKDFTLPAGALPDEGSFAESRFTDLWFGVRWTNANSELIHEPLKAALIYWAEARLLDNNSQIIARAGLRTVRDDDFSDDSGTPLIRDKKVKARDNAQPYVSDARFFLDQNNSTYPEWRKTGGRIFRRPKQGFKFTVVRPHNHTWR